jgi:phytol kinase
MIEVISSLAVVFGLLVISEILWSKKELKGEFGRKFVHITVGTFVAFWPFYMSFKTIQLISIAFLVVVLASRYLKVFKAIHAVNRQSWGDVMFAIAVGLTALLAKNEWVFMAAILHLSLADGLAAIVGTRLGKGNKYKVLGQQKSWIGTLTFLTVSVIIVTVTLLLGTDTTNLMLVGIGLPLAATALENIGIYGLDNVLIPVLVTLVLNRIN